MATASKHKQGRSYSAGINSGGALTPIEQFARDYELPLELAVCFVATEAQARNYGMDREEATEENLKRMREYLEYLVNRYRNTMREIRALKRSETVILIHGEQYTVKRLCEESGLSKAAMHQRIRALLNPPKGND